MITAKVILDSISPSGKRLITLELEFPRIILAEQNTHRVFSRNSQSTRAIPLTRAIQLTLANPYVPVFTKAKTGMSSNEELKRWKQGVSQAAWKASMYFNSAVVWLLGKLGAHKQHAGRLLEPFQYIRVVLSSTEWDNYFSLRDHPDAQPEIQELARKIRVAIERSKPVPVALGEWHLPYVGVREDDGSEGFSEALRMSSSLCAQVSYRRLDFTQKKADTIHAQLMGPPLHASPFEHQATPLEDPGERGGNFVGWEQYRGSLERRLALDELARLSQEMGLYESV